MSGGFCIVSLQLHVFNLLLPANCHQESTYTPSQVRRLNRGHAVVISAMLECYVPVTAGIAMRGSNNVDSCGGEVSLTKIQISVTLLQLRLSIQAMQ